MTYTYHLNIYEFKNIDFANERLGMYTEIHFEGHYLGYKMYTVGTFLFSIKKYIFLNSYSLFSLI